MRNNLFELIYDPDDTFGVYGISLVEEPAIGVMAMKFSKNKKNISQIKFSTEDKRVLVSPVLIPNQKIYRDNAGNGDKGYVYVSAETIGQLQQNFFERCFQHNSSFEHKDKIDRGVFVFESWIVEDPLNDKSNALGFEGIVKGTWMVSMKIEDETIWNDYVLTGKVQGLSIDALLKPIKTNFNKQFNMKKNLSVLFKKAVARRVAMNADLIEVKVTEETTYFVTALEVGGLVYDVNSELVKDIQFEYEGFNYSVNELGEISEKSEVVVEEDFAFSDEEIEAILEEVKEEIVVDYEAQVAELSAKIAELEAELAIYKIAEEKEVELRKQTPSSPIKTNFSKQKIVDATKGVLGVMRDLK